MNKDRLIREYYQKFLEEEAYYLVDVNCLKLDCRIGRVEFVISDEYCDYDFDTVLIESIVKTVPDSIQEAFTRHIWFSQYSFNRIFVFKIPVAHKDTYAVCISGIASDGYDNSGNFIEIFDELGNFVAAAELGEGEINWLDRYIDGDDFNVTAPKWRDRDRVVVEKAWSQEIAVDVQHEGNIIRLKMF